MADLSWTKKTLAEILGEDRGLPDEAAMQAAPFTKADLDELLQDERQTALSAFKLAARTARDSRGEELGTGDTRPEYTEADITAGLRAARSALESVPAGKRSEKANALLADCACPPGAEPEI
ncbi:MULTISPECIES: hypothetical protein [Pseudooceanicola]|uniref:hypothetical protein n=1 Tax=Pseudooceanicola TaxID=1679449 RepID=UPI004059D0F8